MNIIYTLNALVYYYVVYLLINACSKHRAIDYFRAIFTAIFATFFFYFIHVLQHKFNDSIIGRIHTTYHHNPKYKNKWYSTVFEFFNNLILLIFILLNNIVKHFTNVEIFSNYILFISVFYYAWVHFIEFHYTNSCKHIYHHKFDNAENLNHSSVIKNYGPYYMDILFGTNYDCPQNETWLSYLNYILKIYIAYQVTISIYKIK